MHASTKGRPVAPLAHRRKRRRVRAPLRATTADALLPQQVCASLHRGEHEEVSARTNIVAVTRSELHPGQCKVSVTRKGLMLFAQKESLWVTVALLYRPRHT